MSIVWYLLFRLVRGINFRLAVVSVCLVLVIEPSVADVLQCTASPMLNCFKHLQSFSSQPWRITLRRNSPTSSSLCLWSLYTPSCRYLFLINKITKHSSVFVEIYLSVHVPLGESVSPLHSGNVQVWGAWHLVQHVELSEDPVSPWRVFVPCQQGSPPVLGLHPGEDAHPVVSAHNFPSVTEKRKDNLDGNICFQLLV